jgi:hypothetical protein
LGHSPDFIVWGRARTNKNCSANGSPLSKIFKQPTKIYSPRRVALLLLPGAAMTILRVAEHFEPSMYMLELSTRITQFIGSVYVCVEDEMLGLALPRWIIVLPVKK